MDVPSGFVVVSTALVNDKAVDADIVVGNFVSFKTVEMVNFGEVALAVDFDVVEMISDVIYLSEGGFFVVLVLISEVVSLYLKVVVVI